MSSSEIAITEFLPIIMATRHLRAEYDKIAPETSSVLAINGIATLPNLLTSLPNHSFKQVDSYTFEQFGQLEYTQRYDLAVIFLDTTSETRQKDDKVSQNSDIAALIVTCRDLFARHCLVFAPSEQNLTAFGFTKFDTQPIMLEHTSYFAWQFNLFDYKQLPDWFNSRFWANPENWNKFRW